MTPFHCIGFRAGVIHLAMRAGLSPLQGLAFTRPDTTAGCLYLLQLLAAERKHHVRGN